MAINFRGYVFDDAGSAVSGASVQLLETGTTTQEGSTATTDSDGLWYFNEGDQDRYDVKITSGTSVRYRRWDDQIQLKEIDARNNTGNTTPAATFTNLTNNAANQVAVFSGANSTKADGDEIYLSFKLADSAGNIDEFARITVEATDVTTTSEDGQIRFGVAVAGTLTDVFTINSSTGGAATISYEVDSFTIKGGEGEAGVLYLFADQGDDAGDEWKVNVADGGVLTFGNDIASAGSYVTLLTITPHATTASSSVAVAGDATVGDDLSLTSDSSVFNMGAGNDFTITHDGTTGATLAGTPITVNSTGALTLDSSTDITLDADGADVFLKDGGTLFGTLTNSSGELVIKSSSSGTTAITMSGADVTVAGDLTISGDDLKMATNTTTYILVADGTSYNPVAVSGDVAIANDGAVTATAAQTNITSLLATDIKIGEDDQTKIDFEDANTINFYANNAKEVVLAENSISPGTSDGTALGTTSLMWSDLFLASGSVINFNNGDITLTHSSNTLTAAGGTVATAALTTSTIVASGIIKTDDATEATSTTDGSLQTDGGLSVVKDAVFGDDVKLLSDSSVVAFGADGDATLTHTNDTGITLNSTNKLMFNDASQFVQGSSATILSIGATDEIDLTATAVDLNGTLDVSGNSQFSGTLTVGVDDTGLDVKFFGATSGQYMLWDESADALIVTGKAFMNETANANLTVGLTINQGAADDEVMGFKSSDANHPMTGSAEADTYGKITKASGGNGGLMLWGLSDGSGDSMDFYALCGSAASTAKSTSASALYVFYTGISDGGTGVTNPGSNQNLVAIWSGNDTARFILDVEGSGHSDVEWTTYDTHNDLALMDAIEGTMLGRRLTPERFGDNSLYYDRKYLESTQIIGEDSWHVEHREDGRVQNRAMVNWTRLAMLHHGALLQVGDRLAEVEARAELAEKKLLALGAK